MEIIMSASAPAQLAKLYPAQDDLLAGVLCMSGSERPFPLNWLRHTKNNDCFR
jgi:hypothetical protein